MELLISRAAAAELLAAAAATPALEVCGLLLGRREALQSQVTRLVPARNVATNPANSFEIDPAILLATHRNARGEGLQVLGHWHSHPNGALAPSARDAARALDNGQIWLIIAAGRMAAFVAGTGPGPRFRDVAVTVV
jgi:proteasome lid subunit RPN8/RPN11